MNTELKAMLGVLFALSKSIKDLVEKQPVAQVVSDLEPLLLQVPVIASGYASVKGEVEDLVKPENLADILAFITVQFAGIDSDAKAQAILNASLKLASDMAEDSYGLYLAIKG